MKLLPNWKRVMRRAWSVRFSLLATALSAAEAGVQYWLTGTPPPLAIGATLLSLSAGVARVVAQPRTMGSDDA